MKARKAESLFGAFIEPHGIYLIEYKREREGVSILRHFTDTRRLIGLAEGGEKLTALIRSSGAANAQLSAAVRGFGSTYQIMTLPPAEPAVLGAVVRRELTRLNPDMETPRVDFVLGGEVDRRKRNRPDSGHAQQEVLVGAAPSLAVSAFGEELASGGVELEHLTVLPQVIQRLYEQSDGSGQPTACFVELPGGPLIAFFNEGRLRLVVEPPVGDDSSIDARIQELSEHLDRGSLFLRQQFRGAELARLLIAVNPSETDEFLELLRERLGYPVERFPGPPMETGALISMGAVLDGEAEKGLNLSPFAESPELKVERKRRRAIVMFAAAICALSIAWAVVSLATTIKLSKQVASENAIAQARINTLAPLRVIASQRQKNAQSVAYLERISANRSLAQALLRALVRATPPGVQMGSVSMTRTGDEWSVQIAGSAFGETGADVLLAIDRLFHTLPREIAMHDLVLAELDDVTPGDFGAAMKFNLTFVASRPAEKP